ncbi:MAG: lytic transglycosylase domain-containing protein [Gammaproteobacteria bacterium]
MTNETTPRSILHRKQRRRLLGAALTLLSPGVLPSAAAQPARPTDARSGPDPELRKILIAAVAEADSFTDRFDAEVWLTDMSHRLAKQVPDATERLRILKAVHKHATHVNVPAELVLAVIDVESNFDRFAISGASALGLMQVMPFWVKELGYKDKNALFAIETNVLLGCQILRFYLEMERGNLVQGLARYNGSVGRRSYSDRVLDRVRTKWFRQ